MSDLRRTGRSTMPTSKRDELNAEHVPGNGDTGVADSGDGAEDPRLFGRKSVLMGMAATMGVVLASTPQQAAVAATQPAYVPKWTPTTNYALGQQVISPNNDVVSAMVAHKSSATYTTDITKWALSSTYAKGDRTVPGGISQLNRRGSLPEIISLVTGTEDEALGVSNCTLSGDTTNYRVGGRGWKITYSDAISNAFVSMSPVSPSVTGPLMIRPAQALSAWVYIADATKVNNVEFELTQDAADTISWLRANVSAPVQPLITGWNLLRFKLVNGLPAAWTGTSINRLRFYANVNAATTITLGHIWLECPEKARMIFILDRGYKTFINYGGVATCRSLGIPITWALDITLLGRNVGDAFDVVTEAAIAQYAAEGDSISFHGWDGSVTSSMTDAEYRADTVKCIKWLQTRGYEGRMWRAANVQDTAPASATAATQGLLLGNAQSSDPSVRLATWPPVDMHDIPRWYFYGRPNAEVENQFALLQKTHSLMLAYNHGVQAAYPNDATPAEVDHFFGLVRQAIADGWLECTTFENLWRESGGSFGQLGADTVATCTDASGALITKRVL